MYLIYSLYKTEGFTRPPYHPTNQTIDNSNKRKQQFTTNLLITRPPQHNITPNKASQDHCTIEKGRPPNTSTREDNHLTEMDPYKTIHIQKTQTYRPSMSASTSNNMSLQDHLCPQALPNNLSLQDHLHPKSLSLQDHPNQLARMSSCLISASPIYHPSVALITSLHPVSQTNQSWKT